MGFISEKPELFLLLQKESQSFTAYRIPCPKTAGRKITFAVTAYDEKGEIGSGTHSRVIVSSQRFLDKVYDKL